MEHKSEPLEVSNTDPNLSVHLNPDGTVKGGPFRPGDPRINKKGRPKTFENLRKMAQEVAEEPALDAEGHPVLGPDGEPMTRAEVILRQWSKDPDFRKQQSFLEVAYGRVPQPVEAKVEVSGPIPISLVDYREGVSEDEES